MNVQARRASFLWLMTLAAMACDAGSSDPGLAAELRVEGARFAPGAMPAAGAGPTVVEAQVLHNLLHVGTRGEPLTGSLAASGNAVLIGRRGDPGFWIVTAGLPSADEPAFPTFVAPLDLSRDFPIGGFTVELSAVDRAGQVGPRRRLMLQAAQVSVQAELVITLRWDVAADLDLHVIDPAGIEIWARNISSAATAQPTTPDMEDGGNGPSVGLLDFDSNAECVDDGRDEENVSWHAAPPPGRYLVRVASASLCGNASANWETTVTLHGKRIAAARGIALPTDTRWNAGAGSGVTALGFVVP